MSMHELANGYNHIWPPQLTTSVTF